MKISGTLIEAIVNLLRAVGLLTSPDQETELREQLTKLEQTKAQVWVDFVKATSPDPNRVYVWANSLIALVRPAISILIVCGMIFAPARILDLVRTFGEAGPAGWIVVAPLLWWFFGRDVNKVLAMHFGGLIPVGSGAAEPMEPETSRRDLEQLRRESEERWDRVNRLMDELKEGLAREDQLEPALDYPGDR
jgi:alpha-amylase/alpha-mannosidase (GH57 family)